MSSGKSWLAGTMDAIAGATGGGGGGGGNVSTQDPIPSTNAAAAVATNNSAAADSSNVRTTTRSPSPAAIARGHPRCISPLSPIERVNSGGGSIHGGSSIHGGGGASLNGGSLHGNSSLHSVQRVPSRETMERSIHNNSGHGKRSKDQIIRDLRSANASLTSKVAELEVDFMNQCTTLSTKLRDTQDFNLQQSQQLKTVETRYRALEQRSREKDALAKAAKDEAAFQKHAVMDLKNQLFQLQNEMEDAELDRSDQLEAEELMKQRIEALEHDNAQKAQELEQLKKKSQSSSQQEEIQADEVARALVAGGVNDSSDIEVTMQQPQQRQLNLSATSLSPTGRRSRAGSAGSELLQTWTLLDETKDKLTDSECRLKDALESLATMEDKQRKTTKDHELQTTTLQRDLEEVSSKLQKAEASVDAQIASLRETHANELANLQSSIKSKDDAHVQLLQKITLREKEMASMQTEIQQLREECNPTKTKQNIVELETLRRDSESKSMEIDNLQSQLDEARYALTSLASTTNDQNALDEERKQRTSALEAETKMLHEQLEEVRQTATEAQSKFGHELEQCRSDLEDAKARNAALTSTNAALSADMESMKQEMEENMMLSEQAVADVQAVHQKQLDGVHKQLNESQTIVEGLRKELEQMRMEKETTVSNLQEQLETALDNIQRIEKDRNTTVETLQRERDETKTNLLLQNERALLDLEQEKTATKAEMESSKAIQQQLRDEVNRIQLDKDEMQQKHTMEMTELQNANSSAISDMEMKISQYEGASREHEASLEQRNHVIERITGELEETKRVAHIQSEEALKQAENMKQRLEEALSNNERDRTEFESKVMKERESLHQTISDYKREQTDLEAQNEALKISMDALQKEADQALKYQSELQTVQKSLAKLQEETQIGRTEKERLLESLRSELDDARRRVEDANRNHQDDILALEKEADDMVHEHEMDLQDQKDTIRRLEDALTSQQEAVSELNSELDSLRLTQETERTSYEEKIARLEQDLKSGGEGDGSSSSSELQRVKLSLKAREQALLKTKASLDVSRKESAILLSERDSEIDRLRHDLRKTKSAMELLRRKSRRFGNGYHAAKEAGDMPFDELEPELWGKVTAIESEKNLEVEELQSKLEDRDTTISALVKSSVTQEQKLTITQAEVRKLRGQLHEASRAGPEREDLVKRDIEHREEIDSLRERLAGFSESQDRVSGEMKILRREIESLQEENGKLKSELEEEKTRTLGGDEEALHLQDRIDALEEEKKILLFDHEERLRERDGAIATLVKASITQEEQVSDLRAEIEMLRGQLNQGGDDDDGDFDERGPNWEEMRRLQQESEIFAGQIIEQDEEIEELRSHVDEQRSANIALTKDINILKTKLNQMKQSEHDIAGVKEQLEVAQAAYSTSRDEIREMRRRLRQLSPQAERVPNLESQIEKLREEVRKSHMALENHKRKSRNINTDEMLVEDLRMEIERLRGRGESLEMKLAETSRRLHERKASEESRWKAEAAEEKLRRQGIMEQNAKLNEILQEKSAMQQALQDKIKKQNTDLEEWKKQNQAKEESEERMRGEKRKLEQSLEEKMKDQERAAEVLKKHNLVKEEMEVSMRQEKVVLQQEKLALQEEKMTLQQALENKVREQKVMLEEFEKQSFAKEDLILKVRGLEEKHREQSAILAEWKNQERSGIQEVEARNVALEADLRKQLNDAVESRETMEQSLTAQIESLTNELRFRSSGDNETRQLEQDETLKAMEGEVKMQNETISSLQEEIATLQKTLEEKELMEEIAKKQEIFAMKELDEETKIIREQNEALGREVQRLRQELGNGGGGSDSVSGNGSGGESSDGRASNGDDADFDRAQFEKNILAAYERKLSLMQMDKDAVIDGLQNELTESTDKLRAELTERESELHSIEAQYNDLKEEMEAQVQQKNSKIIALERTVVAQEQVVGNMGAEMDQLQSGMEKVSLTRRAEIEELQQELMDSTAQATRQEREITALKMKLEERKLRHKDDVAKLTETIKTMEKDSPMMRNVQSQRDDRRVGELSGAVEQLKWRNASLQEECEKLREKLKRIEAEGRTSSSDKWRNAALQEQIALLSQRIKDLEKENRVLITTARFASPLRPNRDALSTSPRRRVAQSQSPRVGTAGRKSGIYSRGEERLQQLQGGRPEDDSKSTHTSFTERTY